MAVSKVMQFISAVLLLTPVVTDAAADDISRRLVLHSDMDIVSEIVNMKELLSEQASQIQVLTDQLKQKQGNTCLVHAYLFNEEKVIYSTHVLISTSVVEPFPICPRFALRIIQFHFGPSFHISVLTINA